MTRPGIEPRSPRPLANSLLIMHTYILNIGFELILEHS